jgi:phenylalanyl-tRNA synthetase beta chain
VEKFAPRSFYFDTFAAGAGIIPPWLHPGRSARAVADGLTVAWFGQLHPAEAQQRKLRQSVYVGEIYLDRLYRLPLRQPIAPELSRFQPVERDFSFVFPDAVRWQSIAEALGNLRIAELTRFRRERFFAPSCVKALPAGHYSILIRVTFQALERTLREEELQSYSQAVIAALEVAGRAATRVTVSSVTQALQNLLVNYQRAEEQSKVTRARLSCGEAEFAAILLQERNPAFV